MPSRFRCPRPHPRRLRNHRTSALTQCSSPVRKEILTVATSGGADRASVGATSRSASLFLKGIAVLLLYVLLGHPSAYIGLWQRQNWYVLLLAVPVVPLLIVWSAQVLVWRVRLNASMIEIRSLRGVLKRRISDISRLDRVAGRLSLAFSDGSQRTVPRVVGGLDGLLNAIDRRRRAP